MSSVGVKRKLTPPKESSRNDEDQSRGGGRASGVGGNGITGQGGARSGRRLGDRSAEHTGGRGARGGGRGRGEGRGFSRVRGERAMDRQLGQEAPPPDSLHKYVRGPGNSSAKMKDKKLRRGLQSTEKKFEAAAYNAATAEMLLPESEGFLEAEGMERTFKFTQDQLKEAVDLNTAREMYELSLPELGPYAIDYTKNGRFVLLGGRKGHLAMMDALRMDVQMEVQLRETIRDVKTLHNENLVAVAQRKYAYIYDNQGAEVHCLRDHLEPYRLEFLPYHFLLASIGRAGYLKYTDISTGQQVAQMGSKLGACDRRVCFFLRANPHTGVLHAGHHNGVVTMWSPAMGTPLVRMLAHPAPITSLAVEKSGRYMVTSAMDKQTRVWDLRTYREVHAYLTKMPPTDMDISQTGLLSLGFGCHVQVWKDAIAVKAKAPYMEHDLPSRILHRTRFRPLQDVLGLGHTEGYSSMTVPGAGEANFDTYEANPFETSKQRREAEVVSLLEKLAPETIALDPSFVGKVDSDPVALKAEQASGRGWGCLGQNPPLPARAIQEAADTRRPKEAKEKNKTRGRSKARYRAIAKKLKKKQKNVVDEGTKKMREKLDAVKSKERLREDDRKREEQAREAPAALARFFKK
ncbi:unnamed protein product [Ascophyllum nodosum]